MTENEIRLKCSARYFGKKIFYYESIDSTNSIAKSLAREGGEEGTLVVAEEQIAGKGRLGRSWQSEKGKNLTFSLILQPQISHTHIGIVSLFAGVAVCDAIRESTGIAAECKWPNDVLIRGKKVCGILSEIVHPNETQISIIVGVGVNINQALFPEEIKNKATSLFLATGKEQDCADILFNILEQMELLYTFVQNNQYLMIIDRWKDLSNVIDKEVRVDCSGTILTGIAKGIMDDGGLLLETISGPVTVYAGDVTLQKE